MSRVLLMLALQSAAPEASVKADAGVVVDANVGDVDVTVEGWSKKRVELEADLPKGWTAALDGSGKRVTVELSGVGFAGSGQVRLKVPAGGELHVRTRTGNVSASDLTGTAIVATLTGDVEIGGEPKRVLATSTSGDVTVVGAKGRIDAASVSGDVRLVRPRGEVSVEVVSGSVKVTKGALERSSISTVTGTVSLASKLTKGPHEIEVHSGDVDVVLPPKQAVRLKVQTFSGAIRDELTSPTKKAKGSYTRTVGKGGPTLEVSAFDAAVTFSSG